MSDRKVFGFAFLLLSIGCAWPVFASRYLPLVDLPAHASQIALWRAYASDPEVQKHYALHFASPCAALYVPWRALTALGLNIENAGKVIVVGCLLAVPLGLLTLLHSRGRPREWSLLAFPLLFTQQFAWGFLPFYFAFACLFFSLACFSMWLRRPTPGWALLVFASGLLLVWTHALTAGFWGLACGLLAVLDSMPFRRRIIALLPLLPAGAVLLVWSLSQSGRGDTVHFGGTVRQRLFGFFESVSSGTTHAVTGAAGLIRIVVVLVLVTAAASGVAAASRERTLSISAIVRTTLGAIDAPLLATSAAAMLLYLFMPLSMFQSELVCVRFAPMAYLLFIAALPAVTWRSARFGLLAGAAVVSLIVDVAVTRAYRDFNDELGNPHSLFASLPARASVDRLGGTIRGIEPLELRVLDNFALWGQLETLGSAPSFTRFSQMLVRNAAQEPEPLFDATLASNKAGEAVVESASGRVPDALIFFSDDLPPKSLPIVGRHSAYRFLHRTGGLNAFVLER